jgi:hypothetical protein
MSNIKTVQVDYSPGPVTKTESAKTRRRARNAATAPAAATAATTTVAAATAAAAAATATAATNATGAAGAVAAEGKKAAFNQGVAANIARRSSSSSSRVSSNSILNPSIQTIVNKESVVQSKPAKQSAGGKPHVQLMPAKRRIVPHVELVTKAGPAGTGGKMTRHSNSAMHSGSRPAGPAGPIGHRHARARARSRRLLATARVPRKITVHSVTLRKRRDKVEAIKTRIADLPIEKVRAALVAKKLIKPTSKAPEKLLRGMYHDLVMAGGKVE